MKKTGITLGLMILCSFVAKAQKKVVKWDSDVFEIVRSYKIEAGKPVKKETYVFKTQKAKEEVVKAAYEKLNKDMQDANCSAKELEKEKKEFVGMMKGKIEEA